MRTMDAKECQIAFGQYIRRCREMRQLSQLEVANRVDITQSYLSYIEKGEKNIPLELALRLCNAVDMDIRDFANKYL